MNLILTEPFIRETSKSLIFAPRGTKAQILSLAITVGEGRKMGIDAQFKAFVDTGDVQSVELVRGFLEVEDVKLEEEPREIVITRKSDGPD